MRTLHHGIKIVSIGIAGLCILLAIIAVVLFSWNAPPKNFPADITVFQIKQGMTVSSVGDALSAANYVHSATLFKIITLFLDPKGRAQAGDYLMSEPETTLSIASRIVHGKQDLDAYKITIPEGFTGKQIAKLFAQKYPTMKETLLATMLREYEGYLFPDTYTFSPLSTEPDVVGKLTKAFADRTEYLAPAFAGSVHSKKEIVIMASILERETGSDEEKPIVSGILWKRVNTGMPLQVDATFGYTLGKGSAQLTIKDLYTDTLFNTYTNKGLPPSPIANPGLASIEAALHPVDSPYLYFLHDKKRKIHYAATYAEHLENVKKYLR